MKFRKKFNLQYIFRSADFRSMISLIPELLKPEIHFRNKKKTVLKGNYSCPAFFYLKRIFLPRSCKKLPTLDQTLFILFSQISSQNSIIDFKLLL